MEERSRAVLARRGWRMVRRVTDSSPGFFGRLSLAFACFFRALFDARFAASLSPFLTKGALGAPGEAAAAPSSAPAALPAAGGIPGEHDRSGALVLLELFQREGRLIDFLEQDIASFGDADVGAAARTVHEGCRKALRSHVTLTPMRTEPEESVVTVPEGYEPRTVKLTGNVGSKAPYRGTLRHAGWRATELRLPTPLAGHDVTVLAPAEVEL